MVTKGYGWSVEDIDWSCPKELEPYAKAYEKYLKEQDSFAWALGIYVNSAVINSIDVAFNGSDAKSKYIEKPIFSQNDGNTGELSEEEKERQVDLFFKQQDAMRMNWKRRHRENED